MGGKRNSPPIPPVCSSVGCRYLANKSEDSEKENTIAAIISEKWITEASRSDFLDVRSTAFSLMQTIFGTLHHNALQCLRLCLFLASVIGFIKRSSFNDDLR